MKKILSAVTIVLSVFAISSCDNDQVKSGVVTDNIPVKDAKADSIIPVEPYIPESPEEFVETVKSNYSSSEFWKFRGHYRTEYDYMDSKGAWKKFAMATDSKGRFRIETEEARIVSNGEELTFLITIDNSYVTFPSPPSPTGQSLALHAPPVVNMYRFIPALEPFLSGLSEKKTVWSDEDSAYSFKSTNGDQVFAKVNEEGVIQSLSLIDTGRFNFIVEEQTPSPELEENFFVLNIPDNATNVTEQFRSQYNLDDQYAIIGKEASNFTAPFIQGYALDDLEDFKLSDHRGKVILIDFWAMWCPPCLEGLPSLNEFYASIDEDKVIVLAANLDVPDDIQKKTIPWLQKKNISVPNIEAVTADWLDDYAVNPLPYMVLIDADGKVADVYLGSPPAKDALKTQVEDLWQAAQK